MRHDSPPEGLSSAGVAGSVIEDARPGDDEKFAYLRVASILRERLTAGYYSLTPIPSVRNWAKEFEVSTITARKAVGALIDEGLLAREGRALRLTAPHQQRNPLFRLAFLVVPFPSTTQRHCLSELYRVVSGRPVQVRFVPYQTWDDPALLDTISGFDGTFLYVEDTAVPERVRALLAKAGKPVVALPGDLTGQGIPSIRLIPAASTQRLLNHLGERGHTRIACVNTQAHDRIIVERINQWRIWTAARGVTGVPFCDFTAPGIGLTVERAQRTLRERLATLGFPPLPIREALRAEASPRPDLGRLPFTALFGTTVYAALGSMRALRDAGIVPGRDVAVATVDGEDVAGYTHPPITAIEPPPMDGFFNAALQWMTAHARTREAWTGPLLMETPEPNLVARLSTDPAAWRDA